MRVAATALNPTMANGVSTIDTLPCGRFDVTVIGPTSLLSLGDDWAVGAVSQVVFVAARRHTNQAMKAF